eukprot:TRINITY_DN8335_c0_g1_i2.p1 TRINITY_DN8335_c0_g1~~TRINITY_DN8335_c0_g1_i2.p1  ORF type:complete len:180 (-),score=68.39 TRINITY_DN8335_c0_g1_i2:158-697(-)
MIFDGFFSIGKGSLVVLFNQSVFNEGSKAEFETEDRLMRQLEVDGSFVIVDPFEIHNDEQFPQMRDNAISNFNCFVLLYSITDSKSLQDLNEWRDLILKIKGTNNVLMVVVGNKKDLEKDRAVSVEEGKKKAEEFGCSFEEISMKDKDGVNEMFVKVAREMKRLTPIEPSKKKKGCNVM